MTAIYRTWTAPTSLSSDISVDRLSWLSLILMLEQVLNWNLVWWCRTVIDFMFSPPCICWIVALSFAGLCPDCPDRRLPLLFQSARIHLVNLKWNLCLQGTICSQIKVEGQYCIEFSLCYQSSIEFWLLYNRNWCVYCGLPIFFHWLQTILWHPN